MPRQRLQLRQEPISERAARSARGPASEDRALSAADQREGRALPPDDGARVRLRGLARERRSKCRRAAEAGSGCAAIVPLQIALARAFGSPVWRTAARSASRSREKR